MILQDLIFISQRLPKIVTVIFATIYLKKKKREPNFKVLKVPTTDLESVE